ncbi:MAG: CpsD/CapB family tyrosine-protein kinase [Clostridiales bacterium]|nr:CpsD/CapB family tyrosine-protein kinase [Clostridiales bacterium]
MDFITIEAFNTLRTNIQLCGNDIKAIGITSCIPGEGKSSVSIQLAESLAGAGKKVIFIDADLRKSVIVARYRVEQKVIGLTLYLSGVDSSNEFIYNTNIENLDIIVAGPVPPNPSELLGSVKFKEFLEELKSIYDYIIIDTPPLGSVIDSAVIAPICDGMIMVIEANKISYKFAHRVKNQLDRTDCRILGTVLNKVNVKDKSYYSNYYGNYKNRYYSK